MNEKVYETLARIEKVGNDFHRLDSEALTNECPNVDETLDAWDTLHERPFVRELARLVKTLKQELEKPCSNHAWLLGLIDETVLQLAD